MKVDTLFNKLNKTLQILKKREKENREKINDLAKLNSLEFIKEDNLVPDFEEEVILVNIWNNVDGKLSLKEKKPLSKKEFEEMEKTQDFSGLFLSKRPEPGRKNNPHMFQVIIIILS